MLQHKEDITHHSQTVGDPEGVKIRVYELMFTIKNINLNFDVRFEALKKLIKLKNGKV